MNWTSIRPVYIYGPLNYNPVEEWFFHRLKAGRPIPVPGSGMQVTQVREGRGPLCFVCGMQVTQVREGRAPLCMCWGGGGNL